MIITVIGTGNAGCALAAKLVENGHQVRLLKSSDINNQNYDIIQQQQGIYYHNLYVNDADTHFAPLAMVTRDARKAIEGADIVLITVQSPQHPVLATKIAPLLQAGQIVLIIPGNMGSVYFEKTANNGVIFAEGESTPYDARIRQYGSVDILFRNARNAIAFLSAKNKDRLPEIDAMWGAHKYLRTNIVESAMYNPNLIVHTVGCILSASRIEQQKGEYWMYRESFSPAIWNVINQLDIEKNNVIKAYGGLTFITYLEAARWRNSEDLSISPQAAFQIYAQQGSPKGPTDLNSRFIHEDVPIGLVLLESLAENAQIQTPIASSLINIASVLVNKDFRSIGRTLKHLGLSSMDANHIKAFIN